LSYRPPGRATDAVRLPLSIWGSLLARRKLGVVIVLWVALAITGFAVAILGIATGLALGIGALISLLQDRRSKPDFRQRRRTGKGRSE